MDTVLRIVVVVFVLEIHATSTEYNRTTRIPHLLAAVGDTIALPCRIKSSSDLVSWTFKSRHNVEHKIISKNGRIIFKSFQHAKATLVTNEAGKHDLVVHQLRLGDSGLYTCKVGTSSVALGLIIQGRQPFITHVEVGDAVTIDCYTSKKEPACWTFMSFQSSQALLVSVGTTVRANYSDRMRANTNVKGSYYLAIKSVRASDAGLYTCIEEVGIGKRHTTVLLVHGDMPAQQYAVVGDMVTLRCYTSHSDSVDWTFVPSQQKSASDVSFGATVSSKFSDRMYVNTSVKGFYNLVIKSVSVSDAGLYTCVEQDGIGERHPTVLLVHECRIIYKTENRTSANNIYDDETASANETQDNDICWNVFLAITPTICSIAAVIVVLLAYKMRSRKKNRKTVNEVSPDNV